MKRFNIEELVEDFKGLYGANLVSILSISWPEHNVAIVLSENEINNLSKAFEVVGKWRKKGLNTPFFLTRAYILSSLDSFPLEFLSFQRHFKVEYGEDVFSDLKFHKNNVRLQCETELKGKLLLIRRRYLETQGKEKNLVELITLFMPALIRIFSGLLYLKEENIPSSEEQIISKVSDEFQLDKDLLHTLRGIKDSKVKLRDVDVCKLLERLTGELGRISDMVDKLI